MQCSCLVNMGDGEGEILVYKYTTAHRNYKCIECNDTIKAGEKHLYEHVEWEDDSGKFRTCLDCKSIRENLCCGWTYSNMLEEIYNALDSLCSDDNIPWAAFAELTPGAKDCVFKIIEGWWEEE